MTYIMVDVETNGPIPGDFSMIAIGAVAVTSALNNSFLAYLKPITNNYDPNALKVTGITREQSLTFEDALPVIIKFDKYVKTFQKPTFISDNNGFDWQFVNYYFHHFLKNNPFGHSSTNLGSLYKGLVGSVFKNFKHIRKTKHTHNPLDDAKGNAEALLYMKNTLNLDIPLE
jgi:DNA polymerase III epsilon subunit-like protein